MSMLEKLISALAPEVIALLVRLVREVAKSKDPKATAKRSLEEAARVRAFDEAMRKRSKKASR